LPPLSLAGPSSILQRLSFPRSSLQLLCFKYASSVLRISWAFFLPECLDDAAAQWFLKLKTIYQLCLGQGDSLSAGWLAGWQSGPEASASASPLSGWCFPAFPLFRSAEGYGSLLMGFHLFAINLSLFIFIIVRFLCSLFALCPCHLLLQSCLAAFSPARMCVCVCLQ